MASKKMLMLFFLGRGRHSALLSHRPCHRLYWCRIQVPPGCFYSLEVLKLNEKSLSLNLENEFKHFSNLLVDNISLRSSTDYQVLSKINTKTRDCCPWYLNNCIICLLLKLLQNWAWREHKPVQNNSKPSCKSDKSLLSTCLYLLIYALPWLISTFF